MMGALGNAIFFFFSLAGAVVLGTYLLAYAARCLLVVLQGTAAGQDEVVWHDEPIFDWLVHSLHIVGIGLIWLAPAGIASRALRHDLFPDDPLARSLLLGAPLFWFFFPISVLSALSTTHRWLIFRITIVGRLLRVFPSLVAFYVFSAVLVAAPVVPWFFTFSGHGYYLLVAAIGTAAVVLAYARLLGRLAWQITKLQPTIEAPRSEPPGKSKVAKTKRRKKSRSRPVTTDPWAVPAEAMDVPPPPPEPSQRKAWEPPRPHEIEAYGISTDDDPPIANPPPRPRPPRTGRGERAPETPFEVEAYTVAPQSIPEPAEARARPGTSPPATPEIKVPPPVPPPATPDGPLVEDVIKFPFTASSIDPLSRLTLWCLIFGGMLLMIQSFFKNL